MLYDKDSLEAAFANIKLFADSKWVSTDEHGYYRANKCLWHQANDFPSNINKTITNLNETPQIGTSSHVPNYLRDHVDNKLQEHLKTEEPSCLAKIRKPVINDPCISEKVERLFNILNNPDCTKKEIEQKCIEVLYSSHSRHINTEVEECNLEDVTSTNSEDDFLKTIEDLDYEENEDDDDDDDDDAATIDRKEVNFRSQNGSKNSEFTEEVLRNILNSKEIRALWDNDILSETQQMETVPHLQYYDSNSYTPFGRKTAEFQQSFRCDSYPITPQNMNRPSSTPMMPNFTSYPNSTPTSDFPSNPILTVGWNRPGSFPLPTWAQNPHLTSIPQTSLYTTPQTLYYDASSPWNLSPLVSQLTASANLSPLLLPPHQTSQPVFDDANIDNLHLQQSDTKFSMPQTSTSTYSPARRLYSAVLQNQSNHQGMHDSNSSDQIDELEREAIEQYSPSSTNIKTPSNDSIISAEYQELERQALEQYNSASAPDTSIGGQGNEDIPLHATHCGGITSPAAAFLLNNPVLLGFQRSKLNMQLLSMYSNAAAQQYR